MNKQYCISKTGERERERERQTDRQTDRQTETEIERLSEATATPCGKSSKEPQYENLMKTDGVNVTPV